MGRGRSLKTKQKEARVLAKATAKGELQGTAEFKATQRGLQTSLRNHVGKLIDKIDPMELISVIGMTVIIKTGIEWTEEILTQANAFYNVFWIVAPFKEILPSPYQQPSPEPPQDMDSPIVEALEWVISFMCAYLIVHNFGQIVVGVSNITSSVLSMAKGLLGITLV